eukprot:TRINITY_DN1333_c0_g1_i1.p3 TRINITY_DN1333_c0_g1~~TRINITY_DN1333_c0_g1_i1.p3  ORF type:complete len:59 (-),score=5.42 TRINITY_DN1333_c0_g1_i1:12-188(-)
MRAVINPDHSRLVSNLFAKKAMVLMKLQRYNQAVMANRRAMTTDENNWRVFMRQGECF